MDEARWTYRQLGLRGQARQGDAAKLPEIRPHSAIVAGYLGALVMAGAFLAVGSCMSALTHNQVIAVVRNTTLPPELVRRLVVLDFATPVQTVDARQVNDTARIVITGSENGARPNLARGVPGPFAAPRWNMLKPHAGMMRPSTCG